MICVFFYSFVIVYSRLSYNNDFTYEFWLNICLLSIFLWDVKSPFASAEQYEELKYGVGVN